MIGADCRLAAPVSWVKLATVAHDALIRAMAGLATRALDPDLTSGSKVVLETTNALRAPERPELSRRPAVYAASLGQQRLWFLEQLEHAAGAAYRLASGWHLQGRLDRGALRATLDTI